MSCICDTELKYKYISLEINEYVPTLSLETGVTFS